MNYWVSYVRPEADIRALKAVGFLVPLPVVRDYAFLPAIPENVEISEKEVKYYVIFLKDKEGKLLESAEEEVQRMMYEVGGQITKGSQVVVIDGPYQNLEGIVMEEDGDTLLVMADGLTRKYEVKLQRGQVSILTVRQGGIVELGGG